VQKAVTNILLAMFFIADIVSFLVRPIFPAQGGFPYPDVRSLISFFAGSVHSSDQPGATRGSY